jgi:hypothetical protein
MLIGLRGLGDTASDFSPYYTQVAGLSQDDANKMGWILYAHGASMDPLYWQALVKDGGNPFQAWQDYTQTLIASGVQWDPINKVAYLGNYNYTPISQAQIQQLLATAPAADMGTIQTLLSDYSGWQTRPTPFNYIQAVDDFTNANYPNQVLPGAVELCVQKGSQICCLPSGFDPTAEVPGAFNEFHVWNLQDNFTVCNPATVPQPPMFACWSKATGLVPQYTGQCSTAPALPANTTYNALTTAAAQTQPTSTAATVAASTGSSPAATQNIFAATQPAASVPTGPAPQGNALTNGAAQIAPTSAPATTGTDWLSTLESDFSSVTAGQPITIAGSSVSPALLIGGAILAYLLFFRGGN